MNLSFYNQLAASNSAIELPGDLDSTPDALECVAGGRWLLYGSDGLGVGAI